MGGAAGGGFTTPGGGGLPVSPPGAKGVLMGGALGGPWGSIAGAASEGALGQNMKNIANPFGDAGSIFGLPGAAPEMSKIQQGTSVEDVQNAQRDTGGALQSQQALLKALQGQGGLNQQSALMNQLAGANGVGIQQNAANMYGNIAAGGGPNPAQAMLNQATGQNVANQAALMAGQRGAGANVGLLARQAGQQGANTQQQAVGQGATMQANQQLNALQGLSGIGSGLTSAQGSLANQLAGQQIGGVNTNTQANLANQQQMQNAIQGINNSNVSSQGNVNTANAALAQANTAAKQNVIGGVGNSVGSMFSARGGMVPKKMAEGGMSEDQNTSSPQPFNEPQMNPQGPTSSFGRFLSNYSNNMDPSASMPKEEDALKNPAPKGDSGLGQIAGIAAMFASKGGLAKDGGNVKAKKDSQKAEKAGNSYSNDKIPAMLSEGEIVLPRTITQSKNPSIAAARFVEQVLARRKAK